MPQHDLNIANADGATVRSDINDFIAAAASNNSGSSAPSTTVAHQFWADLTNNVLKKRNAANSGWITLRTLDEAFVVSRSSNTVLGVSDVGKIIVATSTFTQTFAAAATLGDGWSIDYRNDGSGTITLDPNGSETIDGLTTLTLLPGQSCHITCNGSAFKTIGLSGASYGTWTPALTFTTPGDLAVTYSQQVGTYTRIGNLVTVTCHLVTTGFTHSTASGASLISGLPFNSKTLTDLRFYAACNVQGISKVSYTQFGVYLNNNASAVICNACAQGQNWTNVQVADCPTGTQQTRFFTLTYQAD